MTTVVIGQEEGNDTMIAVTWLDFDDLHVLVYGPNGEYIVEVDDNGIRVITIRIPVALVRSKYAD